MLPATVRKLLNGDGLASKTGTVIVAAASDGDGRPHFGLLSCGELLAVEDDRILIALWAGSGLDRNAVAAGSMSLMFVEPPEAIYLKLVVEAVAGGAGIGAEVGAEGLEFLDCRVVETRLDTEEGLPIVAGLRFAASEQDEPALLARWERTIAALRVAAG